MERLKSLIVGAAIMTLGAGVIATSAFSQKNAPFGGETDVGFAKQLWDSMKSAKLVGEKRIHVRAFEGNEPHGSIQQVLDTDIKVGKRTARVIVKVNHVGEGVSVLKVHQKPNDFLGAYTVMFKREAGYDPDNQDWFWAKYTKDGSLDKNPKGMQLAGRVAKGMDKGCIACHTSLGGDDREILNDQ